MEYRPISVIQLQKIINSVKEKYDLTVPTYKMQLPNNNTQEVEYDENSINDDATPEEDKEKWRVYKEQELLAQEEINEKSMAYAFYKGIECEIDEDWVEEQKWLEVDIPDNPRDLKVHYIMTELLPTAYDIKLAIAKIMKLSLKGADPEAVKAAEATFRSLLENGE